METLELTRLSSKGQVVIPQHLRDELGFKEGETFAVTGKEDIVILKRVAMPTPKEVFEKLHKWGVKFAKDRNLREEDLQAAIKRVKRA